MKTFKALFIDNGVIKAGEFPVEPDSCFLPFCETDGTDIEYCKCHELETEYERVMREAKANAVECEDQEEAAKVLAESEISGELFILPSGWDYRVEPRDTIIERYDSDRECMVHDTRQQDVAILNRTDEQKDEPDWEAISQLTLPESQEEIFDDLFSQYFKMLHEGHSMCKTGEILRERFTITRKP